MGQSLMKFAPGNGSKMSKLMGEIAQNYYEKHLDESKNWTCTDFHRAVCEVVEDINKHLGNTQFRVPTKEALETAFNNNHKGKEKALTKEEFQKILQEAMMHSGFTGIGAKDILLSIFGVPATALLIKQGIIPKALPNEIFIPVITSATVFVLAKLNKI